MRLCIAVSALAASFAASANTIAWWHFDECAPSTTAPAGTVASDEAPTTYAHVYTIGDNGAMSALHENSGDYLPKYAKPFHGIAVYDPVSDTTRTNHASMKFRVERGGPSPDTDAGRARYGGGLKFDGGKALYSSLAGTSALTVEAFVCTTGGVYNLFAPIVGCVSATSFSSEYWALYMRDDGTIAVRFAAGGSTSVWYSGDGLGKTKVNDGEWHHVAFTYDGSNVRIYVDYVLDKKSSDSSDRVYGKTGNIAVYGDETATWIGGYAYGNAESGGRKYPGLIDEVRVSNDTLTPDQFLRMQPLDMDPDELVRVSFEPDEYNVLLKNDYRNLADMLGPDRPTAVFRKVSGAGTSVYDTETKAGSIMASEAETDVWFEDVASFYQETNDVGKANYVQMPSISKQLYGSDGAAASYTVEMFYKTRSTVRGTTSNRQVLMKFSGTPYFNVLFNATESNLLYVPYTDGANSYLGSLFTNADDGKWHHVAVVVDGTAQAMRFYFDYALDKTKSGTLPSLGSGYSLFFGAKENGGGQWFDGWIDDIRVTRRALEPSEFLTTHPVGTGDASLLALFEQNYDFVCASNAAFSVTGVGEARTGGSAPTFVKESRGTLLLDGTNGNEKATNKYSVRLNKSRVVVPPINLFETDAYTVEFWAKFDGIVDANGPVAADSTALAQHVPILRFAQIDNANYDWYFYRLKGNEKGLQLASSGSYGGWNLPSVVVDGKWHHYALTFEPVPGVATNSYVQFFYDYSPVAGKLTGDATTEKHKFPRLRKRVAGHRLMIGEGTYDQPNLVGEFDAVRISKGVLDPSRFLGYMPNGLVLVIR
jgi:hypothetical protein